MPLHRCTPWGSGGNVLAAAPHGASRKQTSKIIFCTTCVFKLHQRQQRCLCDRIKSRWEQEILRHEQTVHKPAPICEKGRNCPIKSIHGNSQ